jgi:4-hydroxybenzoyl-CoA reductase subunit beta
MLRMDGFAFHHADSPEAAVALYAALDSPTFIAGGTDLLPNLKHRIVRPRNLIGITRALASGWAIVDGAFEIGAGTRLSQLASMTEIPPLAQAAGLVAGPQIRNMGTIGGNVLLDTRCLFYNQTEFWRRSLGWCLKAEGDWCHVIDGPKTCVAAQSSDTVPVLLAMDASIRVLGPSGPRDIRLRELYRFDGMNHIKMAEGELLTHILVPAPGDGFRGVYKKLRRRDSIDFPQLGLAVVGTFDGDVPSSLDIVVGAVNPQPKPIRKLDTFLGAPLTDAAVEQIAELVEKQTRPQTSIIGDAPWRRRMAGQFARTALTELRSA